MLFVRDGTLITSAAQGETLVWDARTGRIVRRYPIGGRLALSPDGRTLALALNSPFPGDPSASVACSTCAPAATASSTADLPDEWIMSLAFTRDGTRIVGAAVRGHARVGHRLGQDRRHLRRQMGRGAAGIVIDRRGLALDRHATTAASGPGTPMARGASGAGSAGPTRQGRLRLDPCTVIDPRGAVLAASLGDGTVALVDLRSKRLVAHPARA